MTPDNDKDNLRRSLEATLEFAASSGGWVVEGGDIAQAQAGAEEETQQTAPADLPILSSPEGGPLAGILEELGDCTRCRLSQGRTHVVFGVGNPDARLLFVGEGPGAEEDKRGEPFVGRAGHLLNKMIAAIGMQRSDVYISNVVKCRPPQNRDPREDEATTCSEFLWKQIDAIKPRAICALGTCAAQTLTGSDETVGRLRGQVLQTRGYNLVATYHPNHLLRNPAAKRQSWEDLKLLLSLLDR
jgi:DNA polymerase